MKRIKITITRSEAGQEVLQLHESALLIAIVADRFVIDDQRGPIAKPGRPKGPHHTKPGSARKGVPEAPSISKVEAGRRRK